MAPSTHPQAQFVPISPEFDLNTLVKNTSNFDYVTRLSTEKLKEHSIQSFEALVLAVVIQSGKPLVIEDWGESLPPWLFSPEWIQQNLGSKPEQVRDIPNEVNIPMTIGHYLRSMVTLASRITSATYKDPKRQRLYLKDIDTPDAWARNLKQVMPESVYYLNDCIEPRTGGDGAIREPNEYGQMVYGKGVAPAGDLMSSLPAEMRALNMMCYIGHEGTYTPAHREMCASLGHNIMVEASENKNGERAGSSIWFMTETKEREVVSEYFLSMLGHDIEVEKHFAQVNAWKKAPFNVWVVEQKVGDLILIPPLAPHQVWNRGTRTMKAAWNRTTVDTLELALHEALPRARMVCREEQYKNKAIVYYTLFKYYELLQRETVEQKMWKYGRIKQVVDDFKRLFALYTEILVSEMFSLKLQGEMDVEFLKYDSNVTCSYCRGNIFNRFLTCKYCIQFGPDEEEDTYDICMDCYAMGRSCACISKLQWVEQWDWSTLVQNYELWRGIVVQADGFFDVARSPQTLDIARKRYGRKPVAEVCQEQLKLRPWIDITKPAVREPSVGMSDEEPEVDDEGRLKKKKGRNNRVTRRKVVPIKNKTHACHICCHHDHNWKLAFCTTCNLAYCYGVLWRAFDLMPQTVMENKEWSCPRCLKICSCGRCRKSTTQKPYSPKGTLLGHDTKKVADYRSVESLVDFSKTNLIWLRSDEENTPHESSRISKLKEQAEIEKSRADSTNEGYLDGIDSTTFSATPGEKASQNSENHGIDPLLLNNIGGTTTHKVDANGYYGSPYATTGMMNNGDVHVAEDTVNENLNFDWTENDGHYDLDEFDTSNSYNQQSASYPSRLTAPVAPVLTSQQSYPDPSHTGQNRMMGAGFYRQGTGADRILFDAPDEYPSTDDAIPETPSQNPNFAFSDLLDPVLQTEETKKRKRHGDPEEEGEFYTSKRQKKLAQSKKAKSEVGEEDDVEYNPRPTNRPRRRSTGKAHYEDLGEDAVPIEEDEGPSAISTHSHHKRKLGNPNSDIELAAQTFNRLSRPDAQQNSISGKKRGRPKKSETQKAAARSASTSRNVIKTPRRSTWLARKEAEDSENEILAELPRRTRLAQISLANEHADLSVAPSNISSGVEDSAVAVITEEEIDSLFDEPIERDSNQYAESTQRRSEERITWKASNTNANVQLATPKPLSDIRWPEAAKPPADVEEHVYVHPTKPAPRPRGRPRKNPLPVDLRSPSPIEDVKIAPIKKLLSLKEKLALKGKSFKIVAAKPVSSGNTPNGKSVPSIPLKSILKSPSIISPKPYVVEASGSIADTTANALAMGSVFDQANNEDTVMVSPVTVQTKLHTSAAPVVKGPTVVRLMSPGSDAEDGTYNSTQSSEDSPALESSDSDASIPAEVPSTARHGFPSRGRGTPNGRGGLAWRGRPPTIRG